MRVARPLSVISSGLITTNMNLIILLKLTQFSITWVHNGTMAITLIEVCQANNGDDNPSTPPPLHSPSSGKTIPATGQYKRYDWFLHGELDCELAKYFAYRFCAWQGFYNMTENKINTCYAYEVFLFSTKNFVSYFPVSFLSLPASPVPVAIVLRRSSC